MLQLYELQLEEPSIQCLIDLEGVYTLFIFIFKSLQSLLFNISICITAGLAEIIYLLQNWLQCGHIITVCDLYTMSNVLDALTSVCTVRSYN